MAKKSNALKTTRGGAAPPSLAVEKGSPPWVGAQVAGCTCGSAGVIALRAIRSETRLQRRRTHQAVIARGIGRVVTASAMSPKTRRRRIGTNQSVMTRGIDGVITASPTLPAAERSAEGALLASSWDGVHDQQEQEECEGAHEVPFSWFNG